MISKAKALSALSGIPQWGLTFLAAAVLATTAVGVCAKAPRAGEVSDNVALSALPPEARRTHQLILAGGPFPYSKDGTTFSNRERRLPGRPRGDYREYTVKTPGSRDRGARRIICGGKPATAPDACYYTADHYNSFSRIAP